MVDVNAFLRHNIEGYLFHDLKAMQQIEVGYPLLMSTFAGIELFGALLSTTPFDARNGRKYFGAYWADHLYPSLQQSGAVGDTLYQLARHGIAHGFVLKGPLGVTTSDPSRHLRQNAQGIFVVNAVALANDLIDGYPRSVKTLSTGTGGNVNRQTVQQRLDEMWSAYQGQAAALQNPGAVPISSASTPLSQSIPSHVSATAAVPSPQTDGSGPELVSRLK